MTSRNGFFVDHVLPINCEETQFQTKNFGTKEIREENDVNSPKVLRLSVDSNLLLDCLAAAWLAAGDCNVIMVDWSQLAADINYVNVKQYVQPVGQLAAQLVDWLVTTQGFRLSDVELVGHSLGGHVVGLIGSNVASGTVPLVTALDPARPLFEDEIPELRLDASDGDFVQVIHTNAGNLGLWEAVGTVDFYPNGGEIMAGCEPDYLGQWRRSASASPP